MSEGIVIQKYSKKIIIYILLKLVHYGLLLLPPYCYLCFLNEVIIGQNYDKLGSIFFLYIIVFGAKTVVLALIQITYNRIFPVMQIECKANVLEKYSDLDLDILQKFTPGELQQRLHKDTENIILFWEKKIEIGVSSIFVVTFMAILLYMNCVLAVISFLVLPLSFWITRKIKSRSNIEYERQRQIIGTYNDFMINNMCFWKEIKSNCLEEIQQKQFEIFWKDIGSAFLNAHMCWFLNRTFLAFKDVFLTKMGLYLLGGILVIKGVSTVPILLAFMEYYADFVNRMLEIGDIIIKLGEQEEAQKRVENILKLHQPNRIKRMGKFESLEFKDIVFSYGEEQEKIFDGFQMKIARGERIAILGESGCGKSTLIKIMAGSLMPDDGMIFWNGCSMDQINRKSIYAKIGFLMQDSKLFNLTIRENLLMGRLDACEKELENACKKANILDFIYGLPQGFETIIGENGIRLSGGQKQRILIARLFLQNPEVIVFDEATSALDYQNESEIMNLLLQNEDDITIVIVTHRKNSVSKCTRVVEI